MKRQLSSDRLFLYQYILISMSPFYQYQRCCRNQTEKSRMYAPLWTVTVPTYLSRLFAQICASQDPVDARTCNSLACFNIVFVVATTLTNILIYKTCLELFMKNSIGRNWVAGTHQFLNQPGRQCESWTNHRAYGSSDSKT